MEYAYTVRYGHQSIYEVTGRNPITEHLTALEEMVLNACLQVHWDREVEIKNGGDGALNPDVNDEV